MKKKRLLTFVFVLLTIGLAAGAVYIGYYLNQQGTTPEDADAGGGAGMCCYETIGCVAGYECVLQTCTDTEAPSSNYRGVNCGMPGQKCRTGFTCQEGVCSLSASEVTINGVVVKVGICREAPDSYPTQYPECNIVCTWPDVMVANRCGLSASTPRCQCKPCDGVKSCTQAEAKGQDYYTGCDADYQFDTCAEAASCPAGTRKVSGCPTGSTNCQQYSCNGYHPQCHNAYRAYYYCSADAGTPTPTLTSTPTVTTTATVTVTTTITGTITGTPSITNTTSPTATVTTTGSITGSPTNTTSPTLPITGSVTITPPIITISVLPTMAIISDKADIVIGGTLLVIIGLTIFALGYNDRIGLFFYNIVGKKSFTSKRYFEEDIDRAISKGDKKKSKKAKK